MGRSAMTKSVPVSVRLPPELNNDVTAIAAALDRSKSWVIEQAVKDYVALQALQLAEIDEGIRDADAGRVVAHEKVVEWIKSWDGPDELPMPECG
jgi:predicted transcriptional regulator